MPTAKCPVKKINPLFPWVSKLKWNKQRSHTFLSPFSCGDFWHKSLPAGIFLRIAGFRIQNPTLQQPYQKQLPWSGWRNGVKTHSKKIGHKEQWQHQPRHEQRGTHKHQSARAVYKQRGNKFAFLRNHSGCDQLYLGPDFSSLLAELPALWSTFATAPSYTRDSLLCQPLSRGSNF